VRINGVVKGTGKGASKKVAEQDAAQSAFRSMRLRRSGGGHQRAEQG
jgi:dsRNA-specific ribonuclease